MESLSNTQMLVDNTKQRLARCLSAVELQRLYLDEPPRWCITGPGLEAESNPNLWEPKWPYRAAEWRDWLIIRDRGDHAHLPVE